MNLQPIWPPSPFRRLPGACSSCSGEVNTDTGFADLDGPPFRAYYCQRCAHLTLGGGRMNELVEAHGRRITNTPQ